MKPPLDYRFSKLSKGSSDTLMGSKKPSTTNLQGIMEEVNASLSNKQSPSAKNSTNKDLPSLIVVAPVSVGQSPRTSPMKASEKVKIMRRMETELLEKISRQIMSSKSHSHSKFTETVTTKDMQLERLNTKEGDFSKTVSNVSSQLIEPPVGAESLRES